MTVTRRILRSAFHLSPAKVYGYARGLVRLRVTGHYADFDEALELCPRVTWTDSRYWRREHRLVERTIRNSSREFGAAALYYRGLLFGRDVASVLDYGGGLGNIYFDGQFQHTAISWNVVEVLEVVEHAKASGLETQKLRFSTEPGRHYDVALFNGALQYLPKPLDVIDSLNANTVLLSNIPLTSAARTHVAIQRVAGTWRHPIWIFGRDDFLPQLKARFPRITEAYHTDGIVAGFRRLQHTTLICER